MRHSLLVTAFTLTILTSASLLFVVQPMVGKLLLPVLGGVPSVWNACMVFFQLVLLGGYMYAHLLSRVRSPWAQVGVHALVLATPWLTLPMTLPALEIATATPAESPMSWLMLALFLMAGLPFFAISTTSPLLQRWFSRTGHPDAHNPYFLYAASNVGSMVALLGYPLVLEPLWSVDVQTWGWAAGYGVLSVGLLACAGLFVSRARNVESATEAQEPAEALTWRRRLSWVGWAFIPSSLMLGVTTFITSDLASSPMIWVVPLIGYLLTFILVFGRKPVRLNHDVTRIMCLLTTFLTVSILVETIHPAWLLLPCHLIVFFLASMVAHGNLAEDAPEPTHLTEFFFWMSAGGVLGGIFNTFLAPHIFTMIWEYPLVLAVVCGLRAPRDEDHEGWDRKDLLWALGVFVGTTCIIFTVELTGMATNPFIPLLAFGAPAVACYHAVERPLRFGASLVAMITAGALFFGGARGQVLEAHRNFFGVLRVMNDPNGEFRVLFHGSTDHGRQRMSARDRCEPLQYYHQKGPVSDIFETTNKGATQIAVVGLGAGSMACYANEKQTWTFFEIDPQVIDIAKDPEMFTFLKNSKAHSIQHVVGDARQELGSVPSGAYDMLFIDAFGGDAIPMHLLTKEAFALYESRVRKGGVIAIHISNRFLDLGPVIATVAADAGLTMRVKADLNVSLEEQQYGYSPSVWAILSREPNALRGLNASRRWGVVDPLPGAQPWTDGYQSLFDAL